MIKISLNDKETGLKKEVHIKKNLAGDFILTEHPDIDVVVMPQKSKVLLLSKENSEHGDFVYRIQDEVMKHLSRKGVINQETIHVGNIFNSLEATFPQTSPDGVQGLMPVIYCLAEYIEDQRPVFKAMVQHKKDLENELLHPDTKDSTELGEVPQEEFKGSIPKYGFPTRGIYRYNY